MRYLYISICILHTTIRNLGAGLGCGFFHTFAPSQKTTIHHGKQPRLRSIYRRPMCWCRRDYREKDVRRLRHLLRRRHLRPHLRQPLLPETDRGGPLAVAQRRNASALRRRERLFLHRRCGRPRLYPRTCTSDLQGIAVGETEKEMMVKD